MDFAALEDIDGVRLTWNIWPNSKLEATKCVIPFASIYTPNKRLPTMPVSLSLGGLGRAVGVALARRAGFQGSARLSGCLAMLIYVVTSYLTMLPWSPAPHTAGATLRTHSV
jgi:hypothetical protein